jgi:hypothetical protein
MRLDAFEHATIGQRQGQAHAVRMLGQRLPLVTESAAARGADKYCRLSSSCHKSFLLFPHEHGP